MSQLSPRVWRLSDRKGSPGLCCTEDGLFLADTPLLERQAAGFAVRPQADLETILSRGFGFKVSLDHVMSGLGTVASALNASDLCRARIAAVHLRIPNLPDAFARLDMQLEDAALKLDRIGKTTAAGDWTPAGGGWDPDKHPRAGTGPNPGWFAPTGGDDSNIGPTLVSDKPADDGRLHLPPGERDDEVADLLEWIANSKPGDTQAIRAEIRRLYSDVGDKMGASALNQALSDVLEDPSIETRQWVLDNYEIYTRTDPAEVGQFGDNLATEALLGPASRLLKPGAETATAAEEAVTAEGTAATEAASRVWGLGWGDRGRAIEKEIKATLPKGVVLADNFPVIDHSAGDLITSIKSIDLNAATYQQPEILARRIDQYVDNLAAFETRTWAGVEVTVTENTQRQLIIAVPKSNMSPAQQKVIDNAILRANNRVNVRIVPF